MSLAFRFVIQSNVGIIRKSNEDCGIASPKIIAVADGMGGHAAGEVASSTVIQTFKDQLDSLPNAANNFQNWLVTTTNLAHSIIGDLIAADNEKRGMGTTLSAIALVGNQIGVGHIGDSRIYRFRNQDLSQISIDHTYVQSLVDSGEITQAEAAQHPRRNLLVRAIDGIHDVTMDIELLDTQIGDRFLLCSDGLTGVVSDQEIASHLARPNLTSVVSQLIELALLAGAPDNVTVAACEIISEDEQLNAGISPIVVGAFEYSEKVELVAKPNRNFLFAKIAVVILAITAGLFSANSWLSSQWYVGISGGNVAIYQGIDQQIGPVSFYSLNLRTELPANTLTTNDFAAIEQGVSIDNADAGLLLVQELWSRSSICESAADGCKP
jgi:protein phosphatase